MPISNVASAAVYYRVLYVPAVATGGAIATAGPGEGRGVPKSVSYRREGRHSQHLFLRLSKINKCSSLPVDFQHLLSFVQGCGSGSGRIRTVLPGSDQYEN